MKSRSDVRMGEVMSVRLIRDALQLSAHALAHSAFQLPAQMAGRLPGLEGMAVPVPGTGRP